MRKSRKIIYKALSRVKVNIRDSYKAIRTMQNLTNAPSTELYHAFDRSIMVDDREIPIRVFEPRDLDPLSGDIIEHIDPNADSKQIELPEELMEQLRKDNIEDPREHLKEVIPGYLIFFHGGGWVIGNIDTYSDLCAEIADISGMSVLSVDYRLAPEHPFPAGLDDCHDAVRQILSFFDEDKETQSRFTLIGDSAGANLAAAVNLKAVAEGQSSCDRQILIYPATNSDYTSKSRFESVITNGEDYLLTRDKLLDYIDMYAPTPELKASEYVAPVLAKNLSGQPSTLIITAEYDPLRDEGEYYGQCLAEAGVPVAVYRVKDAVHGFFSAGTATEYGRAAYLLILSFLGIEIPYSLRSEANVAESTEILNTLGKDLYIRSSITLETLELHEESSES